MSELKSFVRNVGRNRGKPRIWLEGAILLENGFTHKTPWVAQWGDYGFHLKADIAREGVAQRHVAGSPDRPILDINSKALLAPFEHATKYKVTVLGHGHLLVSVHEITNQE